HEPEGSARACAGRLDRHPIAEKPDGLPFVRPQKIGLRRRRRWCCHMRSPFLLIVTTTAQIRCRVVRGGSNCTKVQLLHYGILSVKWLSNAAGPRARFPLENGP